MPNYDEVMAEVRAEGKTPVTLEVADCATTTLIFPATCKNDMKGALAAVVDALEHDGFICDVNIGEDDDQDIVLLITGPEGVGPDAALDWALDIADQIIDGLEQAQVTKPQAKEVSAVELEELELKKTLTCWNCVDQATCEYAFDLYNTNGDCLARK